MIIIILVIIAATFILLLTKGGLADLRGVRNDPMACFQRVQWIKIRAVQIIFLSGRQPKSTSAADVGHMLIAYAKIN